MPLFFAGINRNDPINLPAGWVEYIGKNVEAPSGGSLEWGTSNRVTVSYDGPFLDTLTMVQFLLGRSFRTDGGGLSRTLPHRLPWMPHLICTHVGLRPYRYVQKRQSENFGPFAEYTHMRITGIYTCPDYAVISDTDLAQNFAVNGVPDESRRFVTETYEPSVEGIQRPVGSFEYAETSATGPDIGAEVATGVTQLLSKAQLTLVWRQLPDYGARDADGRPSIQEGLLGSVNNAAWRGFAAGTVLFKALRVVAVPSPLPFPADFFAVPRTWDMHMIFSIFNPPRGDTVRGHNLVPFPGDNKWYKIRSKDAAHTTLYPEGDFSTLFTLNG